MDHIDELPAFESRSASRIRRGDDLWDDRHGGDDRKHQQTLVLGILKKHVGKPWPAVLSELRAKVNGLRGESTRQLIHGYVSSETWIENGVIMHQGLWGPEPLERGCWWSRPTYYVDPKSQALCCMHLRHRNGPFKMPEELPSPNPGDKYMRAGETWYRVRFTPEQVRALKSEKLLNPGRNREEMPRNGSQIQNRETRAISVFHETFHRGFPQRWPWPHCAQEWKEAMEACLGQSQEALVAKLKELPPILMGQDVNSPPYPLNFLAHHWIINIDGPHDDAIKWAPYRFDADGGLEPNPEPDRFQQRLLIKPTVRPVGGKELERIKARIQALREKHEKRARPRV